MLIEKNVPLVLSLTKDLSSALYVTALTNTLLLVLLNALSHQIPILQLKTIPQ